MKLRFSWKVMWFTLAVIGAVLNFAGGLPIQIGLKHLAEELVWGFMFGLGITVLRRERFYWAFPLGLLICEAFWILATLPH